MAKLIVKRLLQAIPLLLAISLVTFFLLFHSPGDYLGQLRLDPRISQEFLDREIRRLGLDKPWYIVWASWVWGIVRYGNFGHSFTYHIPVTQLIGARIVNTFILAFSSTLFAWVIALPLGMIAAIKKDKLVDRLASGLAFLGLSVPAVLLALLAVYVAARTGWFPTGGMRSNEYYELPSAWAKMKDVGYHLILPTFVLGASGIAIYTRQMRSNLLETLQADYVRTAMAKGVPRSKAIMKHALRNALNPLITLFGFAFSDLLSGAFIVENVMAWPGLGRTTIEAYSSKDMFVVAAAVLMAAAMLILGNLIADILLAVNDPRIRYD